MWRCLVTVAVFVLALPFLVANGYAVAASEEGHRQFSAEKNPVVINDENSVEETSKIEYQTGEFARKAINEVKSVEKPAPAKCQINQAAQEALDRAWDQRGKNLAVRELLYQAETAAMPPECDNLKVTSLANEARRLAEENLVSLNAERLSDARAREARLRAREERKKVRDFILFGIFGILGIFCVLTISYAIYGGYRCIASEDEKRAAVDSDKLAVVSLILLCACVLVPFFWWYYRVKYNQVVPTFFFPLDIILEGICFGFLFAGIPGVTALVASKKAITRKGLATLVRGISFVCFAISLFFIAIFTIAYFLET